MSVSRRFLLGSSAAAIYAKSQAAGALGPINQTEGDFDSAALHGVAGDRGALSSYPIVAFGTPVFLSEDRRCGMFIARARSLYKSGIAADPYQAFFVQSVVSNTVVWVREFGGAASLDWSGAKGDGISDDSPFINAMLQNASVNWFQIEDGRNHLLNNPIAVRRAITLSGAGIRRSVLTVNAAIDAIDAQMGSASEHGLHLHDFSIANKKGRPAEEGCGIRLQNAYVAKLSNIAISNLWNGIHVTHSGLSSFDTIYIEGSGNAGLLFDGGGNFDSRIRNFTISGGSYCIRMDDMCDEMIFSDGVCSGAEVALYTNATANSINERPEFCRFSRVSFDSCAQGINLSHATDFVFDSCFISCRPDHGALIGVRGPAENIQFLGTTFLKNGKCAVVVGPNATETDFLACKFIGNSDSASGVHDTLNFNARCGPFLLSSCRFRQGWGVASVPRYHVHIEAGCSEEYIITGNHFKAGAMGSLLVDKHSEHSEVSNNLGL